MQTKTLKLAFTIIGLLFLGCSTERETSNKTTPNNEVIFLKSTQQKLIMIDQNTTTHYQVTYTDANITYGEKQTIRNRYINYVGLFAYDTTNEDHVEIWYIDDSVNIPDECYDGCTIDNYTFPALCGGCGKDDAIDNDDDIREVQEYFF